MSKQIESSKQKHAVPFISEVADSKSLHFSFNLLQSKMCISRPDELEIDYTKTMMGFLLLNQRPRHIAMIGLGGGSLAKYCYRNLPETKITVAEINPHVIALREEFLIPDDDERFQVIEADGADFVRDADQEFDVLLVDGYDQQGQSAQLCSQRFFDDCSRVLAEQGVMAVNLLDIHPLYEVFIDRIGRSFDSNIAEVAANREGNIVVFAANKIAISPHALRSNIHKTQSTWSESNFLTMARQGCDLEALCSSS